MLVAKQLRKITYKESLVEVDEILKYISKKDLEKIPNEIRTLIRENKDKNYKWNYDLTKKFEEQNLNRKTIAFLSYLNIEYLLDKEQADLLREMHRFNEKKYNEKKRKKYNPNNIFRKNNY